MKTWCNTSRSAAVGGVCLLAILVVLSGCTTTGTDNQPAAPVVNQLVKATESWNGATLPAYPTGQPEITLLEVVIPPGARLPVHRHPVIHAGVVLSGELTVVTAEGRTLRLRAGDPIVEVVNTPHYGMNAGTIPVKLIVFYAGRQGGPITVVEQGSEPSKAE